MQKLAQLKKEAESEKLMNAINYSCLISEVTLFWKKLTSSLATSDPKPYKANLAVSSVCANVVQVFAHLGRFQNTLTFKLNSEQIKWNQGLCWLSGKAQGIFFVSEY